jgi:hypothetical protein
MIGRGEHIQCMSWDYFFILVPKIVLIPGTRSTSVSFLDTNTSGHRVNLPPQTPSSSFLTILREIRLPLHSHFGLERFQETNIFSLGKGNMDCDSVKGGEGQ